MTNDCEAMADRNGPKFDVMTNTLTTFLITQKSDQNQREK